MFNSVRARLTLWYVFVFGALLIGFSVLIYVLLSRSLFDQFDRSLSGALHATATEFRSEVDEYHGDARTGAVETLKELQVPNLYTAIFEGNQLLASNFPEGPQTFFPLENLTDASAGNRVAFRTIDGFGDAGARLAWLSVRAGGRDYAVAVAEPLHDLIEQIGAIRRIFYLGLPATLLIAGVSGFLLAKKSLSPVAEMSEQARRIGAANLQERLKVGNPKDELGRLAEVFNGLLARLSRSFENMREFMADASHELRTPLSVIRGEADVALSQDRDAAEYRETIEIIQDEARRLSRIVDDMLALARADAGQHPLKVEEFYLNDLVEVACRAMKVIAARKGVRLTFDPAEDVAFSGDEDLLRRLIMNLLDNAIKYTPAGGSVTVKLAAAAAAVTLSVADTGIGIPAEAAAHVFERFYRVDQARSRADGGSGLGLAIAKWVAEAHRGSIELTSTPGAGSQFTMSLPRSERPL